MFRLTRKVLIALLLVGLVMVGLVPVQASTSTLTFPRTFDFGNGYSITFDWTRSGANDQKDPEFFPHIEGKTLKSGLSWPNFLSGWQGREVIGYGTFVFANETYRDFNEHPLRYISWLYRPLITEIPKGTVLMDKQPCWWFRIPVLSSDDAKITNSIVEFGTSIMIYPISDVAGHWAGDIIQRLNQDFVLWPTAGDSESAEPQHGFLQKRFFNPDRLATVEDSVIWLTMAFPPQNIKREPSPLWEKDPQAAEKYGASYGYMRLIEGKNPSIFAKWTYSLQYFTFVDAALQAGILVPKSDGKLHLNDELSRAQFCQMAVKAAHLADDPTATQKFWDLKDPSWEPYLGAIGACVKNGILSGFPDGSFCPEKALSRAQTVVAIAKLLGYSNIPQDPSTTITPTQTQVTLQFQIGKEEYLKNGSPLKMDTTPTILENRTYLPLRSVAEALGAQVEWNQKEQKVTVTTTFPVHFTDTKTDTTFTATRLELWINQPEARVTTATLYYNSLTTTTATIPLDPSNPQVVPLVLPPGRTMLPLRFVAESLGAQVLWDQESQQITVLYNLPGLIQAKEKAYLPPP
jgi:hypothetical protein